MEDIWAQTGLEPHGDPDAHLLANIYFDNLRNSSTGFQVGMSLLTQTLPCDQLVKLVCLEIIDDYICQRYLVANTIEERNQMRDFLVNYAHVQGRQHPRRHIDSEDNRNKAARIYGVILVLCTDPQLCSDVFDALLCGPADNLVRCDLLLRVLRQVSCLAIGPESLSFTVDLMRPPRLISTLLSIIEETLKTPRLVISKEVQSLCLIVIRIYSSWLGSATETLTRAALQCLPEADAVRCITALVRSASILLISLIIKHIEPLASDTRQKKKLPDYRKETLLIDIANLLTASGGRLIELAKEEEPTDLDKLLRQVIRCLMSHLLHVPNIATACNIALRCITFTTKLVRAHKQSIFALPLDSYIDDFLDPILERIQMPVDMQMSPSASSTSTITTSCSKSVNNNSEEQLFIEYPECDVDSDDFGFVSIMNIKPRRLRERLATLICIVSRLSPSRALNRLENLIENLLTSNSTSWPELSFLAAELPLSLILILSRITTQMKQDLMLLDPSNSCSLSVMEQSVQPENYQCPLNRILDLLLKNKNILVHCNPLISIRYIEAVVNCCIQCNPPPTDETLASAVDYVVGPYGLENENSSDLQPQAASFLHELIVIRGLLVAKAVPQLSSRLEKLLGGFKDPKIRVVLVECIARLLLEEPKDLQEKRENLKSLIAPALQEIRFNLNKNNTLLVNCIGSLRPLCFAIKELGAAVRAFNSPIELARCDGTTILTEIFNPLVPCLRFISMDRGLQTSLSQLIYQMAVCLDEDFLPLMPIALFGMRRGNNYMSILEYMSFYARIVRLFGLRIVEFLTEDFQAAGEVIFRCLAESNRFDQAGRAELLQGAYLLYLTALVDTNTLIPILEQQNDYYAKQVLGMLVISSCDYRQRDVQLQSLSVLQAVCQSWSSPSSSRPNHFTEFMFREIVLACLKAPFKSYSKKLISHHSDDDELERTTTQSQTPDDGFTEVINECADLLKIIYQGAGEMLVDFLRKSALPYYSIPKHLIEEFIFYLKKENFNFQSYLRQFIEEGKPYMIKKHIL